MAKDVAERRGSSTQGKFVAIVTLIAALLIVVTAILASAAGAQPPAGTGENVSAEMAGPTPEQTTAAIEALQRHEEERARELEEPQFEAERQASRHAFEELTGPEAEQLLTSQFGEQLSSLDGDPARDLTDANLIRPLGDGAALVEQEGRKQIMEGTMPVEAKDDEGHLEKVDLDLESVNGAFEPENPLVQVSIGGSADEGVEVGGKGLVLAQTGAEEVPGQLMGGENVFYPEVEAEAATDLLVAPTAGGIELMDMLRSVESPDELQFDLTLPEGASLHAEVGGGIDVQASDGSSLAVISKPEGIDAQGTRVPAQLEIAGPHTLLLRTHHREEDLAYPILIDPEVVYQNWYSPSWYDGQNLQGRSAWAWQSNASWVHGWNEDSEWPGHQGLYIATENGNWTPNVFGQWVLPTQNNNVYMTNAVINPFWRGDQSCTGNAQPFDYDGMWDAVASHYNVIDANDAKNHGNTDLKAYNPAGTPTWGQQFVVGMKTTESFFINCWRNLMIGGVATWYEDWAPPEITGVSGLPTEWVGRDATTRTATVSAYDSGLGIQSVNLVAPSGQSFPWNASWCAGTYESRCENSRTGTVSYTTGAIGAEGNVSLTFKSADPTQKFGSVSRTLKIDGDSPALSLKGETTETTYKLSIETADGSSGAPRSGVKEVKVFLDGAEQTPQKNSCSASGCPFTLNFAYSRALEGLSAGEHNVKVIAYDQLNHSREATTSFVLKAPDTVIDSGPEGLTNVPAQKFTYHSAPEGATFQCSIDGGAFFNCPASGYTTSKLGDGEHTFSVRASNGAGLVDPTPATRSFTVDTTPPDTTIEYGPEGTTNNPNPTFGYSSPDPNADFECRLDSGPFEKCGYQSERITPALLDGSHTFAVRALDRAGNTDPTPATRTFTVDATSPTVTILSGPSGATMSAKPRFTFEASGQSALQCALDPAASESVEPGWRSCSGSTYDEPAASLADGSYVFRVRAVDAAGNEAEDARGFTVDRQAPDTTITSGPSGTTDDPKPSFGFMSSEAGSTFVCRFDSEAFRACSGPGATDTPKAALADGSHSFEVRATDTAGNVDGSPAKRSFTVFTAAPETKILTGPEGPTTSTTPTFTYSADETATFECRVDAAAFASCSQAGKELGAQPEGEHVFEVRARNAAGVDPTPARRVFIVDVSNPEAPALSGEVFTEPGPYGLELNIQARDGNRSAPATTRSGVESATLLIDGQQAAILRNRCSAMGCPDTMQREYQVSPFKAAGAHEYKLLVRDELGHERIVQWGRTMPQTALLKSRVSPEASCEGVVDVKVKHYVGLNCAEKIRAGAGVKSIKAMGGDDVIVGGPAEEKIFAGEGNDIVRGARSNDKIFGEGNNDFLYGGVGDDTIKGGTGNDVIDGGPGADHEFGQEGDDTLRGGQGKDELRGGTSTSKGDTVSFADAISPGFKLDGETTIAGANGQVEGTTGVYVNITNGETGSGTADNGSVDEERGGKDEFFEMENVVGSAFDDVIKRPSSSIHISAGPGADIIRGGGTANEDPGPGDNSVEGEGDNSISHPSAVEFGIQNQASGEPETDLFLSGTQNPENVTVTLGSGGAQFVFGQAPGVAGFGCTGGPTTFSCPLAGGLGAVVLASLGNEDELSIKGRNAFSKGSVTLDGGPGRDVLNGGAAEDVLIDGNAQGSSAKPEQLTGMTGDDVLLQGDGKDVLNGGGGDDLLVSSQVCGDQINGGPGGDNAQFHPFTTGPGVYANLETGELGERASGKHNCSSLSGIEDLEGSPEADVFTGTPKNNLLLGRSGRDVLIGNGGGDHINAKDRELDATINCSNDPKTEVHVDREIDLTKAEKKRHQLKPSLFKGNCNPKRVNFAGPTYDDHNGQVNSPMLAAAGPPVPARFARLQAGEATEPPESSSPVQESEANLASYVAMDDKEGVAATNFFDETDDGTYEAAGQGPSVNGPGPQLGTIGALQEEEGTAVTLDGVDDLISLPDQMGLEEAGAGGGFSVEMLVRFSRAPSAKEYLYSSGPVASGVFLSRAANGVITLATGDDPGAPQVSSYSSISDNSWHQVVGVVEEHTLTLYVDGMRSRVGFGEIVVTPETLESAITAIGTGPGRVGFLAAAVDEFSTYEGPLSESVVQSHLEETIIAEPSEVLVPAPETVDSDGDGVSDSVDNCPRVANANQADTNHDGVGDACLTPDIDGDGVEDASDNCPEAVNSDQTDSNGDGVGDACSQLPPEVTTGAASAIKAESATLGGTVTPGGTATTYKFEYGTTPSYGKSIPVPAASLPSGPTPVAVSQSPSGLSSQTTYHYRLVAENSIGRTEGEDRTFTTAKLPISEQLAKMPVTEPFDGSATSLNNFNSVWSALSWTGKKGEDSKSGWRPIDAYPTVDGVFYNKFIASSANGIATAATLVGGPTISERYFSLWLGMPSPTTSPRSGYELRFTETATANSYEVTMASWSAGTKTVLAQKAGYSLSAGSQFAIVAKEGFVSVWVGNGSSWSELLSAKSAAFNSGYSGLEAAGNITHLSNFKTGALS